MNMKNHSISKIFHKIKSIIKHKIRGEASTEYLISKGLTVGRNFKRMDGCIIDSSHCWLISIGDNVTLAPRVHILAHDASTKMLLNYTKIGLVTIGHNVFIGASTTILPNVKVGDNVIIGAGSVIVKDIPNNVLVAGNPARIISSIETYHDKESEKMKNSSVFDECWTENAGITDERKSEMKMRLTKNGVGYIV